MSMLDRDVVRAQYADEENLRTRMQVWHPTPDGREPTAEALTAVLELEPSFVVEVGCGTGAFAARVSAALPATRVVGLDQSERMVELTQARGVEAQIGDAAHLPFDDASVDVVAALWMLYHVPDLDAALAEFRRVLRPGGRLVAVTNGDRHVADLRVEAGGEPIITSFSSQNGESLLRRHFEQVDRADFATQAAFADAEAALSYLRTTGEPVEWALEPFTEPRVFAGEVTLFVAS